MALNWIGAAFLLWLAWKIATAGESDAAAERKPVGFIGAAAFQWINPKSCWACASAAGTYLNAKFGSALAQAIAFGALFILASLPCCFVGLAFGATAQRVLGSLNAWNISWNFLEPWSGFGPFFHSKSLVPVSVNTMPYILIIVFSVQLGWSPAMGAGSEGGLREYLRHLVLPTVALALIPLGVITRVVRSAALDVLAQEFVVALAAKGLWRRTVFDLCECLGSRVARHRHFSHLDDL